WMFYIGILGGLVYGYFLHMAVRGLGEYTLFDSRIPNKTEGAQSIGAFIVLIIPVLWIGFFRPQDAYFIGPVGIAAVFAISAAYFLAALTVISARGPYKIPMIVVLLFMIWATTNRWVAAILAAVSFGVVVLWIVRWVYERANKPLKPWVTGWRGLWTLAGALLLTAFGAVSAVLLWTPPACGTLSGCNVVKGVEPGSRAQLRTVDSFEAWEGRTAPTVRLVAAQGGGLYAAYHTAYYLAARADLEEDFANSVFAISGVSGGSVGAAVFWAIVKSGHCENSAETDRCHRDAVQDILRYDFLSPTLATFLFRDAFDTVVPISYLSDAPIDRASVLESMFSAKVDGVLGTENLLGTALADSWAPDAGVPVLMLNATEVGTGERRILSPLPLLPRDVPARILLEGGNDLTIGNAMTISARFPFVTPPARIRRADETGKIVVRQLVDGGYFDNSGIETLLEAVGDLVELKQAGQLEVLAFDVEGGGPEITIKGLIGAPIGAFTGAWRARRDLTGARLGAMVADQQNDLDPLVSRQPVESLLRPLRTAKSAYAVLPVEKLQVCQVRMFEQTMNFTVSWYLTPDTFREIEIQMDDLAERMAGGLCPDG
ncbi:MAG: hypothetical protein QNJ20_17975, partial [Paracoccaceae bacterium]|nr:hypothetical protein [Paracoccaceae bacterium]